MLERIEDRIFARLQPVSDWIHEWTGLDCILQARICALVTALGWLLVILETVRGGFDWIGAFCMLGRVSRAFWEMDDDALARSAGRSGSRNPRRFTTMDLLGRCITSGLLVPVSILGVTHIPGYVTVAVFMWCGFYLEACDVQTPRSGRIREWLAQMNLGFQQKVPVR